MLSNRKLLALLLIKKGMTVKFAENGKVCLETVQSQGLDFFDIIFMDNTMPVMVSYEIFCMCVKYCPSIKRTLSLLTCGYFDGLSRRVSRQLASCVEWATGS
ncbi:response regulator [archaeon]|nr:MAG: response regulator [archaeon]